MINKTLVWNCRGVDQQGTLLQLKMLIVEHRPQVVALLKICMHSQNLFCYFHSTYLSNMIAREAHGYAGGIWLFWDREAVQLDGVTIHKQVVSVLVHEKNKHQWMLSIVCASLRPIVRKDLWRYNLDMGAQINIPWVLIGGFNQIVAAKEKQGGRSFNPIMALKLIDTIDQCHLLDLGFQGTTFTWTNCRNKVARIREKLDLTQCNETWSQKFEEIIM